MENYIGLKLVKAEPMNRLDYNEFRGWKLPTDENGSDKGFLIEYLNGGQANTAKYEGYISWSPEAVFENAYLLLAEGLIELNRDSKEDWQLRTIDEYEALMEKINKLVSYLEKHQDESLEKQINFMVGYAVILENRINSWEK